MNVGVVEKNGVVDPGDQHGLHDFPRAGRATGMQQYLLLATGWDEARPFRFVHGIRLTDLPVFFHRQPPFPVAGKGFSLVRTPLCRAGENDHSAGGESTAPWLPG
jgi:hypothetical protein